MPRFFTTKLSQTDPDVLVSRDRLQAAATISSAILHARSAGSLTPSMFALNLFVKRLPKLTLDRRPILALTHFW